MILNFSWKSITDLSSYSTSQQVSSFKITSKTFLSLSYLLIVLEGSLIVIVLGAVSVLMR